MRQVLVLAVAMFVACVAQAQKAKVFTAADFPNSAPKCTNNKASFKVDVGTGLPAYQIRLIQDPVSAEMGTVHHVGRVEILRERSLVETIEVESIWNDSLCSFFAMKDVNFDGDLDIAVLRDGGAKWGQYDYYVFDRAAGQFVSNALTEDLGRIQSNGIGLNRESHEIEAPFFRGRCAGVNTYKVENGRLEKTEEQQVTPKGDECQITVKQSFNGSWQVVRNSRTLDMSDPGF